MVLIQGIYMIREIMKGIRIVKCYAWEAAMEAPTTASRDFVFVCSKHCHFLIFLEFCFFLPVFVGKCICFC